MPLCGELSCHIACSDAVWVYLQHLSCTQELSGQKNNMKVTVHVKPGSRKESIDWVENLFWEKTLVVKIREKPVDGEANRGLIEALSEFFFFF